MNGNLLTGLIACGVILAAAAALKVLDWIRSDAADLNRLLDLDGPDERGEDSYGGRGHDPHHDVDEPAPGTGPRIREGWRP